MSFEFGKKVNRTDGLEKAAKYEHYAGEIFDIISFEGEDFESNDVFDKNVKRAEVEIDQLLREFGKDETKDILAVTRTKIINSFSNTKPEQFKILNQFISDQIRKIDLMNEFS